MSLINGDAEPAPARGKKAPPVENDLIKRIEAEVKGRLTAEVRENIDKIVAAGLKVAVNGGENSPLAMLQGSQDVVSDAAIGAVNLAALMKKESKGTMPDNAMAPAALILTLHALDFAERLGMVEVTPEVVNQATQIYAHQLTKVNGITPQMLEKAGGQVKQVLQDPVAMEQIARHSGVVKTAQASTPTDLPTEEAAPQGLINQPREASDG